MPRRPYLAVTGAHASEDGVAYADMGSVAGHEAPNLGHEDVHPYLHRKHKLNNE